MRGSADSYSGIMDPRVKLRRLQAEKQMVEESWTCDCGSQNTQGLCPNCDYND
ncbi:hypothetical protein LCGC14_2220740 [marine sediment metagenome]|uniref:Uncharacterized protein n=1 Tax=marine sediment metagenome TaxID=412755 RepID=A0A0F9DB23_9ZZZZ